ncbi:VWA domain-containing protein [Alphaproteobacteria bacterium GH1-50]|uniref:VWA domain-containing protein n=1 Tax=Kangsaoukella pontilimi TaxID=2691042 RepID=A0A7C9MCX3_9RHOB|nr:VWA domain-containing protein [Kangsaoukella pontilimi]MXQ09753.1 VWA domain-containing protein [Kangsaoukella pontilimi]
MTEAAGVISGRAHLVGRLLAINPTGLGGVWLRARHGAPRDRLTAPLFKELGEIRTVSGTVDDLALFGGVDMTESLLRGVPVMRKGLAEGSGPLAVQGAERLTADRASRLAACCDQRRALVLLDEGSQDEALPHRALRDRLAFMLDECAPDSLSDPVSARSTLDAAARLAECRLTDKETDALVSVAARLGLSDLRAPLLAAETLRTLKALSDTAAPEILLGCAAQLVFGHRALPQDEAATPPPPAEEPSQPDRPDDGGDADADAAFAQNMLVDAISTSLPADVLISLTSRSAVARGQGKGIARRSVLRGRPLPSRAGKVSSGSRVDLLATLSAAAPWQALRNATPGRTAVRPEDIRIRQYKERSERTIIFAVDMSGSAAFARLAEGKGAIEHLLGRAYSERDRVALVTFRDAGAELVLPPTRALTRAKRSLQGLHAGGATPLAAGMKAALDVAAQAVRAGQTPHLVIISDGRANCALDGSNDRQQARSDALLLARHVRSAGIPVTLLDSGARTSPALAELAQSLGTEVHSLKRSSASAALDGLVPTL